jgi:hypothetical protein
VIIFSKPLLDYQQCETWDEFPPGRAPRNFCSVTYNDVRRLIRQIIIPHETRMIRQKTLEEDEMIITKSTFDPLFLFKRIRWIL